MAVLRKVTVEFHKNEKNGKVYVEFFPELSEPNDRSVLLAKFKKEAELILVKDNSSWSNFFKVVRVPSYHSGHTWLDLELDLLRANKPPEWSEEYYKKQITRGVWALCRFIKYHIDDIEEGLLRDKLPEVRWTTKRKATLRSDKALTKSVA